MCSSLTTLRSSQRISNGIPSYSIRDGWRTFVVALIDHPPIRKFTITRDVIKDEEPRSIRVETGLLGNYDFMLTWEPGWPSQSAGFFTEEPDDQDYRGNSGHKEGIRHGG